MQVICLMGMSKLDTQAVFDKVKHLIPYYTQEQQEQVSYQCANRQLVLLEMLDRWADRIAAIKENKPPIVIAVGCDFTYVKENIVKEGGKIDVDTYKNFKHIQSISRPVSVDIAVRQIKSLCKKSNRKHIIYKATSPSGKIYVGKTVGDLEVRIKKHAYDAKFLNKEWPFSKAIRKYGIENIVFKVERVVFGAEKTNEVEKELINLYKSNQKENGYNATGGGEGRSWLNEEAEKERRRKISEALSRPEARKKLSENSKKAWQNQESAKKRAANINKTRSTEESRAKTSVATKKWYEEGDGKAKTSEASRRIYSDPEFRKTQSVLSRKKRERLFVCHDDFGNYIGIFKNNMEAAEKLNIPQCGISSVLNGRQRQTRGYIFEYIPDPIKPTGGNHEHE